MIEAIKKELIKLSDKKYQEFSSSLIPNSNNILGVRLPILKQFAKKIDKNNYATFIKENDDKYMELTILEGILISKMDFNNQLKYLDDFIKKINNWEICDTFCNDLKTFKNNKIKVKKIIEKYINSSSEYELHFCYVILLNYFIDDDLKYVLDKINNFNNEKYYAKMAVAWCLSICFVKHYNEMIDKFNTLNLSNWVKKKSLTKTIESLRLNKKQKEQLKLIRNQII